MYFKGFHLLSWAFASLAVGMIFVGALALIQCLVENLPQYFLIWVAIVFLGWAIIYFVPSVRNVINYIVNSVE